MRGGESNSAAEFVEGVAGAEVGEETGGSLPVAAEIRALANVIVVTRAKVFEVGDGERIGRTTIAPRGGVDFIPWFATVDQGVATVFPVAVVGKSDGELEPDAEGFGNDFRGLPDFFQGAGDDDVIEVIVFERAH